MKARRVKKGRSPFQDLAWKFNGAKGCVSYCREVLWSLHRRGCIDSITYNKAESFLYDVVLDNVASVYADEKTKILEGLQRSGSIQ